MSSPASMLAVESLTMAFGGVRAIDELSFRIRPGPVHSIIVPNGAGKTTLFNLITGVYQPTSGRILLDGKDLARRSAHQRACSGMIRTFQNLQICMNMTALENVMLGEHQHLDHRFLPALLSLPRVRRGERESRERSAELMAFVGLSGYIDSDASAMPYGALKRLEIARALVTSPKLILLDEPFAGVDPVAKEEIQAEIRRLKNEFGKSVLITDHDAERTLEVCDRALIIDAGKVLKEGTPREIIADDTVRKVYLGNTFRAGDDYEHAVA